MQSLCNAKYRELCTQLGAIAVQKDHLDKQYTSKLAEMAMLNDLVPGLNQLEAQIKADADASARSKYEPKEAQAPADTGGDNAGRPQPA